MISKSASVWDRFRCRRAGSPLSGWMRKRRRGGAMGSRFVGLEPMEPRLLLTGVPAITEFMASNTTGIMDQDGDRSDWIEIHNPGNSPLDLFGYTLTDQPNTLNLWTFPTTIVPAGGYIVVFASGKNRAVSGNQLHTNFTLATAGEYLALVDPSGTTILSEFNTYPQQSANVSYGVLGDVVNEQLVNQSAGFFETATPGAANVENSAIAGAVNVSGDFVPFAGNVDRLDFNSSFVSGSAPLARYALDESSGTSTVDSVGGNAPGSLFGGASFVPGRFGNAVNLGGTADAVNLPSGIMNSFAGTVSLWFNTTIDPGGNNDYGIMFYGWDGAGTGNGLGTENELHLGLRGGNGSQVRPHMFISNGSFFGGVNITAGFMNLNDGQWHHMAATWDDAANSVVIYVDGVAVANAGHNGNIFNFTGRMRLGMADDNGSNRDYNGLLDEVQLFNRALTAAEIAEVYANGTYTSAGGEQWYEVALEEGGSLSVLAAQSAGLNLVNNQTPGAMTLELYDRSQNLLAVADPTGGGLEQLINGFVAPHAGNYYLKLTGTSGIFNFSVVRNAHIDAEPNNTLATAQDIHDVGQVIADINPVGDNDYYSFEADFGDVITLSTETPIYPTTGQPNQVGGTGTFVAFNSSWKYLHPTNGVSPNTANPNFNTTWFTGAYDDTAWTSGNGTFGYGAIDGQTIVTDIGLPPSGQRYTAYFRTAFNASGPVDGLTLRFHRDDGVIIYLNGVEVARNAPQGSAANFFTAPDDYFLLVAGFGTEGEIIEIQLPGNLIQNGTNLLAVSLHNTDTASSDLGFDAQLTYTGIRQWNGVLQTSFSEPATGARNFNGTLTELGFTSSTSFAAGATGVTEGDEYHIDGANFSGQGPLIVSTENISLANHGRVRVSIDVRSFEDSPTSDFEDADFFAAVVQATRPDGGVDVLPIFNLSGVALKNLGETLQTRSVVLDERYTSAQLVVAGSVDSSTEHLYFDNIRFESLPLVDPIIEVYDENDQLIGSNDNGAGGVDAQLQIVAQSNGTYKVRVRSVNDSSGATLLTVAGHNLPTPQFAVISSDPANGQGLVDAPQFITVNFNFPLDPDTLDADDLTVDGVPATNVSIVDGDTVQFDVPISLGSGPHTIAIAGGVLSSDTGEPIQPFNAIFTLVTPPSVINGSASNIGFTTADIAANVTATGGQNPTLTIYYGDNDGGTDAGQWDSFINLGAVLAGTHTAMLSGLTHNTQYFYRAFVSNVAGDVWAPSTATFTTNEILLPTVANGSVSGISGNRATIAAQLVSTGGVDAQLLLYYGDNDGGTNAGAWDHVIDFGVVDPGTYTELLTGLLSQTQYFYRAFASNLIGGAFAPATATFTTLEADLPYINEIMADNETVLADEDGAYSDWFELYNPDTSPRHIGGWYLTDNAGNRTKWQIPIGVNIPAQGYLVVFASSKNRGGPGTELHTNFALNNNGEYLALVRSDGVTIVHEYAPTFPALGGDQSYGVIPDSVDLTTTFLEVPTPGARNIVVDPKQQIIINELMYNPNITPTNERPLEEWIELYNRGTEAVDLTGWQFTAGINFTFPAVTIQPGGYVIVAANVARFNARYPTVTAPVVGGWTGVLSNNGENIELVDELGERISRFTYADDGDWATRTRVQVGGRNGWDWVALHDEGGRSLELRNPFLSNDHGQNWGASNTNLGTPGAQNSLYNLNIAPMIVNATHFPIIPTSADNVFVTAKLIDEMIASVTAQVFYRVDGVATYSTSPMFDDGAHGDGEAGDGVYGAVLPPQANGTIVEFYIQATDGLLTRTWPAPAMVNNQPQQITNMLYQVEDTPPTSMQPVYRVIMTAADRQALQDIINNAPNSDAQQHLTWITSDGFETLVVYNGGIRIRGQSSRTRDPRSFRINLPDATPWKGVSSLNLNAQYIHAQLIGMTIMREAGLVQEDARAVQLRINGVNPAGTGLPTFGSYLHLETLDGDFVDNHFPLDNGGNLYRGSNGDLTLGSIGGNLTTNYEKRTNEEENNYSDIINLVQTINNTPDDQFVAALEQVINLEEWMRWFATMAWLASNENGLYNGRGDDYSMYRGIDDPRFILFAHDLDNVLGQGDAPPASNQTIFKANAESNNPAINRILLHPQIVGMYYAQLLELERTVFAPDNINSLLDQYLDWVPAGTVAQMKTWIEQRRTYILSQIPTNFSVTTNLTVSNGLPRSTGNAVVISGNIPTHETWTVVVNDLPAVVNGRAGTYSASSAQVSGVTLMNTGHIWRYLDNGSDQGTAWRLPGFNDDGWASGPSELGYGDGGEATVINGGPTNNRFPTSYFRTTLNIPDVSALTSVTLGLMYDDGAAVYVNGVEVVRANLAANAAYDSFALSTNQNEGVYESFTINPSVFQNGANTIAVEVHQVNGTSSDVSMDMRITATVAAGADNSLGLFPGINRVQVRAFDRNGQVVRQGFIDVWYDTATPTNISGTISTDTVLRAADGPYMVTGNLTVAPGATLTIEPNTTVYFAANTNLTVNGRLVANGDEDGYIFMRMLPGAPGQWGGIQFVNTDQDNRLSYVVMRSADLGDQMIRVENSTVTIDHMDWAATNKRIIDFTNSSIVIADSAFPSVAGNVAIRGSGEKTGGQMVIEGNTFARMIGQGAAVQYTGSGAAPTTANTLQVLDNLFVGGADDGVVLMGANALIEGNRFEAFVKAHGGAGYANAVRAAGQLSTSSIVHLVRNSFVGNDYAVQIADGSTAVITNNTFVNGNFAAVSFDDPNLPDAAGAGALIQNSIFFANDSELANFVNGVTAITVNHSIISPIHHSRGTGNLSGDPMFVNLPADLSLKPGSPAWRAGTNGEDLGASQPAGAIVYGEPTPATASNSASLTVGGPGVVAYRYRVNNGAMAGPFDVTSPINLNGLTPGNYTVEVFGINFAGVEQAVPTQSLTWTVDPAYAAIRINEVMALNRSAVSVGGAFPDLIELYNAGATTIDLGGMSISDNPNNPTKHVFAPGTLIHPGQYLVFVADGSAAAGHVNFSLAAEGEGVYLYDASATLTDSVEFGLQIADMSIGRARDGVTWELNRPTFGMANEAIQTGNANAIKINEWLANGDFFITTDFIELFNPGSTPVNLGGLHLTDNYPGNPLQFVIPALSFIGPEGFAVYFPDNDPEDGPTHTNFRLSANMEQIALLDAQGKLIDFVQYGPQKVDVSMGRSPDAGAAIVSFSVPTPGTPNPHTGGPTVLVDVLEFQDVWRYNDTGADLGTGWRLPGYNDAAWSSGAGPIGYDPGNPTPIPVGTTINDPLANNPYIITYYFRKTFTYTGGLNGATLELRMLLDDAAVVYLNGTELIRPNMPGGAINASTLAAQNGEANVYLSFSVPANALVNGLNTLAVEVHQGSTNSSDVMMGLELKVALPASGSTTTNTERLLNGLRITEIMFDPPDGGDYEFIELQNVGGEMMNLDGVRFTNGIDFTFGDIDLAPGAFIVVAKNVAAFQSKYDPSIPLAGQFGGQLDNGGEQITLTLPSPLTANILNFAYDNDWFDTGVTSRRSINMTNISAPIDQWNNEAAWRPSINFVGTPGHARGIDDPTGDTLFNAADIDFMHQAIRDGSTNSQLDLNFSGEINFADTREMIEGIMGTFLGDINLDLSVGISDLSRLATFFGANNATWGMGDLNGDGVVNITDLSLLATYFGAVGSGPINPGGGAGATSSVDLLSEAASPSKSAKQVVYHAPVTAGAAGGSTQWGHIGNVLDGDDTVDLLA